MHLPGRSIIIELLYCQKGGNVFGSSVGKCAVPAAGRRLEAHRHVGHWRGAHLSRHRQGYGALAAAADRLRRDPDESLSEEFALEMIQDALLFQDRKAFSTIDAAVISLKTGILKLLKAGGMATFIRHRNSVERIVPAALPPGCRINQQFDLKYKKLYDGDMVIMVSDGMLEFESMPEIPFRMESLIEKIKTDNAQVFADQLIEAVPVLEDGYDDDRTVLVASIWEKGHRNVE